MSNKKTMCSLLFSGHIHVLALVVTASLFSSKNSLFILSYEIILKVVLEEDPNYIWIKKLKNYFDLKEYAPQIQQHVFPCYRLLMTCKGFYHDYNLKQSFHKTVLNFPSLIKNIFVLNSIFKERNPEEFDSNNPYFIQDEQITDQHHRFLKTKPNTIIIDGIDKKIVLSLTEFLTRNMILSYARSIAGKTFDYNAIEIILKNHFELLNYACINTDLTLPSVHDPETSIAEFIFNDLSQKNRICRNFQKNDSKNIDERILEIYKKRNSLDTVPEYIPVDLTLFLSDEAFKKLSSTAKSKIKSNEYNKKLLNWILPELPADSIYQHFIRRIRVIFSPFFKTATILITIIKNCFNNHIN